jgi:hypothetical protein
VLTRRPPPTDAAAGLLFGWAAHVSPVTEQPPSSILRAYNNALAGWGALGVLVALMLVMGVVGGYAAYQWRRRGSAGAVRRVEHQGRHVYDGGSTA